MFPKKSSQWSFALGWDQEGVEGGGYTFASMPINKQQLRNVNIKTTSISNTIKDEQFTQRSVCTLWLNRCVLCLNLLCVCVCVFFVVSWEIHCTMKGNVVQNLHKATEALAFFPLAMQGWCTLSILAMGELNGPLDHPLGPSWNKEMCHNRTKLCILGSCWAHGG